MSCGVDCRHVSDLALLWLWCKLAATAPIRSLAWEPPCGMVMALKRQNNNNNNKQEKKLAHKQREIKYEFSYFKFRIRDLSAKFSS